MWNSAPGAMSLLPEFSDALRSYPFFYPQLGARVGEKFTAVIYATTPVMFSSSPLFRLIRTVAKSAYTHKVSIGYSDITLRCAIRSVKPVLSGHSKIDKTKILMTNGSLMKVKSIAECSKGSILQYF